MKSTGITRKVDNLGRIVLPINLRREFNIDVKDPIEMYTEGEKVILQKYNPKCQITGKTSADNLILRDGKLVLSKEGAELIKQELESYLQVAPTEK